MLITDAIRRYRNDMLAMGLSRYTINGAKSALNELATFLATKDVTDIAQMNREALMQYREEIGWRPTHKGTPLSIMSQLGLLGHLSAFCRYLVAEGFLLADPSLNIPRPKKPKRLPRNIMEMQEVEQILELPNVRDLRGFRDRTIMEMLYSTALRRGEIADLLLNDVDVDGGYVFVREGKGRKDRVVPLGKNVCDLVKSYLVGVRPQWPNLKKDRHLFLNRWGNGMNPNAIGAVVRKYADLSDLNKQVSTHAFRHSCATHLLKNGAPIRQLQEMLGHESLESTQIYTHVTINDLQEMHKKFHPRERKCDK